MATPVFLKKSDFVGEIEIDFGNYDEFNSFAIDIEDKYCYQLLGVDLGRELVNAPSSYDYIVLGEQNNWIDSRFAAPYDKKRLRGLKKMLQYFFYFEFITRVQDKRTLSGDPQEAYVRSIQGERHIKNNHLVMIYNKGVDCWNEIHDWLTFQIDVEKNDTVETWQRHEKLKHLNTFGII
jgi:hypothetical protein